MKKSKPKKYAKFWPKDRKGMENLAKIAPKIINKSIQNSMSKNDQKEIKKTQLNSGLTSNSQRKTRRYMMLFRHSKNNHGKLAWYCSDSDLCCEFVNAWGPYGSVWRNFH